MNPDEDVLADEAPPAPLSDVLIDEPVADVGPLSDVLADMP